MRACNQCGKCCIKYGAKDLAVSDADVTWWDQHRPDIYQFVNNGNIWTDPNTGKPVKRCPWLTKQANNIYICSIYYDRPEDCRLYPSRINEMISDQCEMLEPIDFYDLKQAKIRLNKLMRDSRSAN